MYQKLLCCQIRPTGQKSVVVKQAGGVQLSGSPGGFPDVRALRLELIRGCRVIINLDGECGKERQIDSKTLKNSYPCIKANWSGIRFGSSLSVFYLFTFVHPEPAGK